ncbi:(Fe-S)-binding protein [Pseudodesulfovibrio nedwellii]|uniref:(Fe-S)-binding protein n=1 Tax=Pseudodesulfovibrio nedwellii TaxID=2973072 RepID=A0ABN6S6N8_9BACT|nr:MULTISPECIES: 4Fe-4S dicluster domain-containing protein [Pseudodesulfovibrio]BDQ37959.1 (Fe-S)-binding protein [Pseudodesulfovibrio nedwellii]
MSRIEVQEDRCKGCLLCTTVCPVDIIVQSDRFNVSGYKVAEVPEADADKCTGCASCAMICPDVAITVYRTPKKKGGK